MIAAEVMNELQPSVRQVKIKPHKIKPRVKNGKKSAIGELKILPNTNPIDEIMTAILMVSQKGPTFDRLYRCFTSCQPSIKKS